MKFIVLKSSWTLHLLLKLPFMIVDALCINYCIAICISTYFSTLSGMFRSLRMNVEKNTNRQIGQYRTESDKAKSEIWVISMTMKSFILLFLTCKYFGGFHMDNLYSQLFWSHTTCLKLCITVHSTK